MKTNITVKLEVDLLRKVRILAAQEGTSISALLSDKLEKMVRERKVDDRARNRAVQRLHAGLELNWKPPLSRDGSTSDKAFVDTNILVYGDGCSTGTEESV